MRQFVVLAWLASLVVVSPVMAQTVPPPDGGEAAVAPQLAKEQESTNFSALVIDLFGALQEVSGRPGSHASTKSGDAVSQLTASILEYAKREPAQLDHTIREALIEIAGRLDRVSIAVTGLAWLGATPSVLLGGLVVMGIGLICAHYLRRPS